MDAAVHLRDVKTAVYRIFDATGRLLYVGVAVNPEVRIGVHLRDKLWRAEVDCSRTAIHWYDDRPSAFAAETVAITQECPKYNAHWPANPGATPPSARLRVSDDLWSAYAEIVGNAGRSADIKAYIEWRIDNPTAPLPGRRRGPVRRDRKSTESPGSTPAQP